jgi:hypothetical protein
MNTAGSPPDKAARETEIEASCALAYAEGLVTASNSGGG